MAALELVGGAPSASSGPPARPAHRPSARLLAWGVALLAALLLQPLFERIEPGLFDLRGSMPAHPPAADLVIVDIDEASLAVLGPWPWSRDRLATLAERLRAAGARQQIWDITLAEPRTGDDRLKAALAHGDIVVGSIPVIDPRVVNPPRQGLGVALPPALATQLPGQLCAAGSPFPRASGHIGLAETLAPAPMGHLAPSLAADGRLRRLPAVVCLDGAPIASLALAGNAARLAAAASPWRLRAGTWPWQAPWQLDTPFGALPLDAEGHLALDFSTPLEAYTSLPAYPFLGEPVRPAADPAAPLPLAGKTVLLGSTALGIGDRVATARSPVTPGVAVHAQLHTLLARAALPQPLRAPYAVAFLLAALTTLPLVFYRPARRRRAVPAAFAAAAAALGGVLALQAGLRLPLLPLLAVHLLFAIATLLAGYIEERLARRQLQRKLAALLPPALLDQLDRLDQDSSPRDIVSARHARFGLVHARLRNLGRYAAQHPAETVLALLHAVHQIAQRCAERHGAQLYPGHSHELQLVWPDLDPARDAPAMLRASRELHRDITAVLVPLAGDPPLAVAATAHIDNALDGFIGRHDRRRPILYGSLTQVTEQLLPLTAELAAPILYTEALAPYVPAEQAHHCGVFKLPDILVPHTLYAPRGVMDPYPPLDCAA